MKKAVNWILVAAILVFVITWGVMGLNLANGDYDVQLEAYIGLGCLVVIFACALYKRLSDKCPYCGRVYTGSGEYCSHCGKKKN